MEEYEKIINKTKNWIIQGGLVVPHLGFLSGYSLTKGQEELNPGYGLNFLMTFFQEEGRKDNWVEDQDYVYKLGKKAEDNPEIAGLVIKKWLIKKEAYYKFLKKLEEKGITNILDEYRQFRKRYGEEYSIGFITECFTPWSDIMIDRILKELPKEAKDDIHFMALPTDKSFMNDEEQSSLAIGLELIKVSKKEGKKIKGISLKLIKEDYPEVYKMLEQHQKNFFWIQNNYKHTEPIPVDIFFNRIKNAVCSSTEEKMKEELEFLKDYKNNMDKKREEIIKKWNLSKRIQDKLHLISKLAWLHDRKKKANLIGNYWTNVFIEAATKKLNMKVIDMQFMLPDEFEKALEGGEIDFKEIGARKKGCVLINLINGKNWLIHGKEFEKYKQEILMKEIDANIKDFRGASASRGVAQGKVKIVLNPKRDSLEKGQILVTHMTRPDFVPLMKKAAAIVTDEGGIISHAAIISRELGIPCVVGTKIATKVLKTGDLVEVNANHGLIRIIKRGTKDE